MDIFNALFDKIKNIRFTNNIESFNQNLTLTNKREEIRWMFAERRWQSFRSFLVTTVTETKISTQMNSVYRGMCMLFTKAANNVTLLKCNLSKIYL